jgi:3-dehydroquinate synthetase
MEINFPATWQIAASKSINYEIVYSPDLFSVGNSELCGLNNNGRRLVIVDEFIYSKFQTEINRYFQANSSFYEIHKVRVNEEDKELTTALQIIDKFENFGIVRKSEPIIAIGGGSLLDVVGFACSIYRRGIPYLRIPTTLLSIVDVSVAIKTGVNHLNRRNRLGSYFPPQKVLINRKFIASQSDRDISNGLGEIVKLAIINDYGLFVLLEENSQLLLDEKFQFGAVPVKIINRSISVMLSNLQNNLWEDKLERAVDFGHTFGPLIEQINLPILQHGEAVALDCLFSSCISFERGLITSEELQRIYRLIRSLGLPTYHKSFVNQQILFDALSDSVKHRNGDQNLPLPAKIGFCEFINDLTESDIKNAVLVFDNLDKEFTNAKV